MKTLIVLAAVLAMGSAALKGGLRVRFGLGLGIGKDFFMKVPQTVANAQSEAWVKMERPPSALPSLDMYCADPPILCTLYDTINNYVAGVQISLPINEFKDPSFDWDVQGFIHWKPNVTSGEPVEYMTKQLYFISKDTLSKSKEERLKAAEAQEVLQEKSVWVTSFNKELLEVPVAENKVISAGFTKQACIPLMGQHYYYNMRKETKCQADTILNWFPLYNDGKCSGMGFVAMGNLMEKAAKYFEKPPKLAVEAIVPDGPDCLYELASNPTLTTCHIYFVDEPWRIFCPLFG